MPCPAPSGSPAGRRTSPGWRCGTRPTSGRRSCRCARPPTAWPTPRSCPGPTCAARSARSPRPCAGSACSAATGWPATCRTCPRPSSPSWAARRSARSGRPARRTSARAPCSTGSPRSSRWCWSPSTATGSAAASTTGPTSSPSCGRPCPRCGRRSRCPGCATTSRPAPCPGPTRSPTSRSRASRSCPSTTRSGSSTPRAPPGCPRGSCTGTAGWPSSSSSRAGCTWTSGPVTGSPGTPPPPGSCGTSRPARC